MTARPTVVRTAAVAALAAVVNTSDADMVAAFATPDVTAAVKLVDIALTTEWQVGTASPSFGSRELSYLPYPGEMVTERTNMGFVYVSLEAKVTRDLREFLGEQRRSP